MFQLKLKHQKNAVSVLLEPSPLGDGLFTGLNNLKVVSVLDDSYAEYFGFTQHEVDKLLDVYGIASRKEEVKEWYNGGCYLC